MVFGEVKARRDDRQQVQVTLLRTIGKKKHAKLKMKHDESSVERSCSLGEADGVPAQIVYSEVTTEENVTNNPERATGDVDVQSYKR